MAHRTYHRRSGGQFTRPTLESAFGLSCDWCPKCGIGNPYKVGEERPVKCHECGAEMRPAPAPADPFDFDSDVKDL